MPRQGSQRRSGAVLAVLLSMIALVAVYAARGTQRPEPSAVATNDQAPPPAVVDDKARKKLAHTTTCEAVDRAIDARMVFDLAYDIEDLGDGTSHVTTAALVSGRRVDISAILQWDAERQGWEVLEAYVGGAAVPVSGSSGR